MAKKTGKKPIAATKKPATTKAKTTATASRRPRRVKQPVYKTFRLSKRIKHPITLPKSHQIFVTAMKLVWRHNKLFVGIALVYGLANVLFQGQGLLSSTDVAGLKAYFNQGGLAPGLTVLAGLLGSSGGASSGAVSSVQFVLMILVSLALIWALRQVLANQPVTVREAYYRSATPFIPFILILLVIALQLIPLLIGSSLYQLVITNGIAVYAVEKLMWLLLFVLLALLSLYMISSSIFALYIVTLPNMTPMVALRSARQLVRNRRWTVLRKVIVLPLILFVIAAVIMVPVIIWLTPLTQVVFFAYTTLVFVMIHAYMYTLYRELLNE